MLSVGVNLLMIVLIQYHNAVTMSSLGKQFVIAVPEMFSRSVDHTPQITFYLSTTNLESEINFTTLWFSQESPPDKVFLVTPQQGTLFTVDLEYSSQINIGPKGSFRLVGTALFTVIVAIHAAPSVSSTFLAVPVDSWGVKYYVATLEGNPSVLIISSKNKNEVQVLLRVNTKQLKIEFLGVYYGDGDKLILLLEQWRAFVVSKCEDPETLSNGSLTGTFIFSKYNVGVVSGNCLASVPPRSCDTYVGATHRSRSDLAAEMMLPKNAFGTEFLLLALERRLYGYYFVLAAYNRTKMYISTYHLGGSKGRVIYVANRTVIEPKGSTKIKSNYPMMVVYVYTSHCQDPSESWGPEQVNGGPGLCLIIPKHLFYWAYYWTQSHDTSAYSEAVVVVKRADTDYLRAGGAPVQGVNWSAIMGEPDWTIGHIDTSNGHYVAIFSSILSNFACYAFRRTIYTSSLNPAGFYLCEETKAVSGDRVDNDCDGRVDEEKLDGVDDDNDHRLDEDLARAEVPWDNHSNKTKCKGGECYQLCPHCVDECETLTRACDSCTAGFKNPETGCFRECDLYEYGINCEKSCIVNCGRNCLDNKTGKCPTDILKYTLLLLLILPIGLVVWAMDKRPKEEDQNLLDSVRSLSIVNLFDTTITGRDETPKEVIQLMSISDHTRDK